MRNFFLYSKEPYSKFELNLQYSENWNRYRSNLDSILQQIASFGFKNEAFLSFYGKLDSFYVENGVLKYYLGFSFDCTHFKSQNKRFVSILQNCSKALYMTIMGK